MRRGRHTIGRTTGDRPGGLRGTAVLVAALGVLAVAGAADAQEEERVPRIPSGISLVVTPVQSVVPTASGGWPGGADTRQEALAAVNSEVDFAISEDPLAHKWTAPGEVVEQAGRNPMLEVDPEHLAYRGLLAERDESGLYEPLHSELRRLSALLDARLVAVPLRVWYAPADTVAAGRDGGERAEGARREEGRAVVRIAVVDTRAGRVLWTGDIASDPAAGDSPAALATLAANLVQTLTSS